MVNRKRKPAALRISLSRQTRRDLSEASSVSLLDEGNQPWKVLYDEAVLEYRSNQRRDEGGLQTSECMLGLPALPALSGRTPQIGSSHLKPSQQA